MARKKKSKPMRAGTCRIVRGKNGSRRKICKGRDGKVRFRKMSYKPR